MKKISIFLSAFALFLGIFSVNTYAAVDYLPFSRPSGFQYSLLFDYNGTDIYLLSQSPIKYDTGVKRAFVTGQYFVYSSNGNVLDSMSFADYSAVSGTMVTNRSIKASDHDIIDRALGTVFFSRPPIQVPESLNNFVQYVMNQSLIILPIAVIIMASLMGVSLISRVLYRYL